MNTKEKRELIKEYWEANVKGDTRYHSTWQNKHFTFVRWSLRRFKEGAELTQIVEVGSYHHSNLKYMVSKKTDEVVKSNKRGRPAGSKNKKDNS